MGADRAGMQILDHWNSAIPESSEGFGANGNTPPGHNLQETGISPGWGWDGVCASRDGRHTRSDGSRQASMGMISLMIATI